MNLNTFERKTFLNETMNNTGIKKLFDFAERNNSAIVSVNLLRATANEAESFKKFLKDLSLVNINDVIIDLSKSSFIDSTFLSTIVSFNKRNDLLGKVKLIVKDARQNALLRITKIDTIFDIYSNLEEAF